MSKKDLSLSFDIGHSSIGWAVFHRSEDAPKTVLGCGTVLFQSDSCLASKRRANRRTRRNIAARRSRVARLKKYLESLGVLTAEQLDQPVNSYPWLLAARVLASGGKEKLSWSELWGVLRWYAHNRGYDGNALWAGSQVDTEEDSETNEDAERVQNAKKLMEEFGKSTMAETVCAVLGVDPLGDKKSSIEYFKGKNVAFPRHTVRNEIRKILEAHKGVLQKLDDNFISTLIEKVPSETRTQLKLPKRFSEKGGLLLGQYVPRFDNRIIGKCRITGKNVPLKNCREYLLYRWGRLMNNLTVFDTAGGVRTLTPDERVKLHEKMKEAGFFDKRTLNKALKEVSGCDPANTEGYFIIEEMEEALVLDPVKKEIAKKSPLKDVWEYFSDRGKKIFASQLAKGKEITLKDCKEKMKAWGDWNSSKFDAKLAELQKEADKNKKKKNLTTQKISADFPQGRASYCRELLKKTFDEALQGKDSIQEGGCLYEWIPEIQDRLLKQDLAAQTNNHMVRHRLTIFERLLGDIIHDYAEGDATSIVDVTVEVVRELQEFSGLDSHEISKKLGEKLGNFRAVSKKLKEVADKLGAPVTAKLLYKARLLEDQNLICPYTGKKLKYEDLFGDALEIEHIIPRSLRPSDALNSCVMTFREVNLMKGQRTAMEFIKDCHKQQVPGKDKDCRVQSLEDFTEWVKKHKNRYKSPKAVNGKKRETDDQARCRKRAELLLVEKYDQRNAEFTARDLTQTSYLNKMAIRLVEQKFGIRAHHLAGAVTGFVRKNMKIDECLIDAVPRIKKVAEEKRKKGDKLLKADMRDLSHLHHAMDAVVQGLTSLLFKDEHFEMLANYRRLKPYQREILQRNYPGVLRFSENGDLSMAQLGDELKKNIRDCLAECRVVQHVPAKMHGMSVDQTTWGVVVSFDEKSGKVKLAQKTADLKKGRYDDDGKRFVKLAEEKPSLLLGYDPASNGKLQKIKGVVQIGENWGCALDPKPEVIPYFKVFPHLRELREKNGGKPVRVIRNGMLIKVSKGTYKGVWKIASIKDGAKGVKLDLFSPDRVRKEKGVDDYKENVVLATLLKSGMEILKPRLTGICLTTSSQ